MDPNSQPAAKKIYNHDIIKLKSTTSGRYLLSFATPACNQDAIKLEYFSFIKKAPCIFITQFLLHKTVVFSLECAKG